MNKFAIIGAVLVAIVAGGILYNEQFVVETCPEGTGVSKSFTVVSKKLEWRFEPEEITVDLCDRVHVKVINEDNFDHGFAIDVFGISQRLPANGTIEVDFVATQPGTFPFYCSVSCSDSKSTGNLQDGKVQAGPYAGTFRGHFEHLGKFIVKAIEALLIN